MFFLDTKDLLVQKDPFAADKEPEHKLTFDLNQP